MIQNYYNKKYTDGFFNVSSTYGFLPVENPLKVLPETYKELQLNLNLDQDRTSMEDIIDVVTDDLLVKNPWFFSYCIHKYERSNNLTQDNRCWSINSINPVPNKKLLLELAQQYK